MTLNFTILGFMLFMVLIVYINAFSAFALMVLFDFVLILTKWSILELLGKNKPIRLQVVNNGN